MLIADRTLVRRIEAAECHLLESVVHAVSAEAGSTVVPLAGGVATFVRPGSPLNKLAGLGFVPDVDEGLLGTIETAFRQQGESLSAEVTTLADPTLWDVLARRGYRLTGFENVFGLALSSDSERRSGTSGDGIRVSPVGADDGPVWADTLITGFAHSDGSHPERVVLPPAALTEVIADMARAAGVRRYVARIGDAAVGAASLRLHDGIAQLSGAATLPAWRRRGVQAALLDTRLRDAVAAGGEVAVMVAEPGSQSAANAVRQGFTLLYARAVLRQES